MPPQGLQGICCMPGWKGCLRLCGALFAFAAAAPALAQSQPEAGVQVGALTCENVPGTRMTLLIHSTVDLVCQFRTPNGTERYKGETGIGLGIDLNISKTERLVFTVLMASEDVRIGSYALAGKYYGAKASATVGGGVGASVLVGGGAKNVTLQPVGVEGSYGLGVAAGVGYLYLEPDQG